MIIIIRMVSAQLSTVVGDDCAPVRHFIHFIQVLAGYHCALKLGTVCADPAPQVSMKVWVCNKEDS
jgi:hypothetical protein